MFMLDHMWIIPALPLAGAALNGLLGKPHPTRLTNAIALGSTGLAFFAVLELIREFAQLPASEIPKVTAYFPWILAGAFRADFALQIDQLTVVMLLVVTGVGWLIHIYATGYMAHEGGYGRFFAYLNLFMFFMLILVMAANYLLMFVGWEGVGLCSYLLIGFYFHKKSAADAGKKAFIVNRIGDLGFLLAMFLTFATFDSLNYSDVFASAAGRPVEGMGEFGVLTAIALLMFVGATGKSAQVPLYVWLPDAMEGPTPVSALIHAATMVTAGVYIVARSSMIFSHSLTALAVVAVIGCFTAILAATIALVQTDIKRVLAYSTVSQLGYMFLACGVGAYSAGIFHLMTHSFFKALLFLAAGSVIHAIAGEQDMRRMGGLRAKIPVTYWTMLMGALAIAGAPLFSGFFSKDAILFQTFTSPSGNKALYAIGLFVALLTSFYMFRLIFLTFHGAPRFDQHRIHVHESPRVMTTPLIVLAVLSVAGGWMAAPVLWHGVDYFEHYLAPVFTFAAAQKAALAVAAHDLYNTELALMGAAILAAAIGFFAAWRFYIKRPEAPQKLAASRPGPYRLLLNKYYVDEMYDALIVRPIHRVSQNVLWQFFDVRVIDATVNGAADAARDFGDRLRQINSGNTRSYAAWVIVGAVIFTGLLLWMAG
ncbi:MAG: NADH-quinone oxidoreductase subunit L [Candidatus Acidiferrales bacterium]